MSIKSGFSEVTFKKKQVGVDVTVEQRTWVCVHSEVGRLQQRENLEKSRYGHSRRASIVSRLCGWRHTAVNFLPHFLPTFPGEQETRNPLSSTTRVSLFIVYYCVCLYFTKAQFWSTMFCRPTVVRFAAIQQWDCRWGQGSSSQSYKGHRSPALTVLPGQTLLSQINQFSF